MTKKKRVKELRIVDIQFQAYSFYIDSYSNKDAMDKAIARLTRKGIRGMIDKKNSGVSKY